MLDPANLTTKELIRFHSRYSDLEDNGINYDKQQIEMDLKKDKAQLEYGKRKLNSSIHEINYKTIHPFYKVQCNSNYSKAKSHIYFEIPHGSYKVIDCHLKLFINDFNIDLFEYLKDDEFNSGFPSDLLSNLLLCKMIGKEIIYEDDYILIPLLLFDGLANKKFPLYKINKTKKFNTITFSFHKLHILNAELIMSYIEKPKYHNYQPDDKDYDFSYLGSIKRSQPTHISGKILMIIIRLIPKYGQDCPTVGQISLSVMDREPMIFSDDIISIDLLGQTFHCLSFIKNAKNENKLKKIHKRDDLYFEGINLTPFDGKMKFTFNLLDDHIDNYDIEYHFITYNNIVLSNGGFYNTFLRLIILVV